MNERLPQIVIEEDHRLEKSAESASESLARHRWHWTLDEGNPERVSLRQYARDVGRDYNAIYRSANGYAAYSADDSGVITLDEAKHRASMSAETEAAVQVVAEARKVSFGHARKERYEEVKTVRDSARELAERKGTQTIDEIPAVAERIYASIGAERRDGDEKHDQKLLRYIEVTRHLHSAMRDLKEAVRAAGRLDWTEEERELLLHTTSEVRRLLALVDQRISGALFDWESEVNTILEAQNA